MSDLHYLGAVEIYIKGVHYRYDHTWKDAICYLYANGITRTQHRELVSIRREFSTTIHIVRDGLLELDRSMDAGEPEHARLDTWASIKRAKAYRTELVDRAIKVVMASAK